ncbi:MAG: YicC/YloC family endoribonuclease [Acidobacteriota bacterium]
MRSMTGFGQGASEDAAHRVTVTLRGVNHRFLDLSLRLRDAQHDLERPLRDLLTGHLERGRVEVVLDVESLTPGTPTVWVDEALVRAINDSMTHLTARGMLQGQLHFSDLLRMPDALRVETATQDAIDPDLALAAASNALDQLLEAKRKEGVQLQSALAERLDAFATLLETMTQRAATLPNKAQEALRERLGRMLEGIDVDAGRVAQEAAILADKADVREELDRLGSHLAHARELLALDGSVGKRLDFLAQEIFRELNTIGSKCRDAEMVRHVLDGKVLCEQLREQVQNVE